MATYDNRDVITYTFPAVNFGGGNSARTLRLPRGAEGKVLGALVSVTTSFTGTTTAARLQLGVSGTLTRFLDMPLGAAGAGPAANAALEASNIVGAIRNDTIPADTDIIVTFLAPTGTPAGVADVHLILSAQ